MSTSPSDTPTPSTPTALALDPGAVKLMAITLHRAGRSTHDLTAAQIAAAYQALRDERAAADADAGERSRRELLQREADAADRRRRDRVARCRAELAAHGRAPDGLDDDQVLAAARELRDAAERERQAVERRRRAELLFARAECPGRHVLHLDQVDQNPRWIHVRDTLAERTGDGYLVALLGPRGTGKTQLAVSVIHQACQRGLACRYVKALDLFRLIRGTYAPTARGTAGEREADVVDELAALDVLVIDEAHQRAGTAFEHNTLTNLLDRRYDAMRSTILIANESREAFAESVGPSVVSRIHEAGDAIECDWPSYRRPGMWQAGDDAAARPGTGTRNGPAGTPGSPASASQTRDPARASSAYPMRPAGFSGHDSMTGRTHG